MKDAVGKVYLVGAGPGDPALLTLRGKEILERAQVVIYDSLVNEALLRHAPDAEHIFAGKRPGRHPLTQEDINRLLIEQAGHADCLVRLKGGDPFVFGRGGEEAAALAAAGVPFEVVPGVTAGLGAAAYAGIPLTHRGSSDRVTLITGHAQFPEGEAQPAFDDLPSKGTLVFYMGVDKMAANMRALTTAGRPPNTPVAVVEWGTLPRQRCIVGTIHDIAHRCVEAGIDAPSIVVVGDVVNLRDTLSWFEQRPLFGTKVAVTRTKERAATLVQLLREQGADVFEFPTVAIETPPPQTPPAPVSGYDWIVLTSINGVDTLFEQLLAAGQDARDLHGVMLCAISTKTAEALSDRSIRVDVVPGRYETEFVLRQLEDAGGDLAGKRVLMPRADIGRSSLPKALRDRGADVDELQTYRTVVPQDMEARAEHLMRYAPQYITFGSAVSVRNFHEILGSDRVSKLSKRARYAAIGPIAAKAAQEIGITVHVVPEVHRVPELVSAILQDQAKSGF